MMLRLSILAVLLICFAAFAFTAVEKFTGAEDHTISLEDASKLALNYQSENPDGVKSHFFGRQAVEAILAQESVVGLRIYYGLDNEGVQHLVVVGTDADQNDLTRGLLAERAAMCPPLCGDNNELNTPMPENQGKVVAR